LREIALDATVVLTIASGLHYAWIVTRRSNLAAAASQGSSPAPKDPTHWTDGPSGIPIRIFGRHGVFNFHIAKLFGIKDFATLEAFDELCVIVPGDDAHARVSAQGSHDFNFGSWIRAVLQW
jgi:hypothetical protein